MDGNKTKRPLNLGTSVQQGKPKQQKVVPTNPSPSFPSNTTTTTSQPQNNNNVPTSERKIVQHHPHLEQIRKLVREINEDKWIDPFGPELIFGTKYFKVKEGEKLPTLETLSIGSVLDTVCASIKDTNNNKGLYLSQILSPSHNTAVDVSFNSVNLLQLLKESKDFSSEWKLHNNTDFEVSIQTVSATIDFIKSFFSRKNTVGVGVEAVIGQILAQVIVDAAGKPQHEDQIKSIIEGLPKLIQRQEVSPKHFVIKLFEISESQKKPLPLHLVWMLHKTDLLHFSEFIQCIRTAEEIASVVSRLKDMITMADRSAADVKELLLYLVSLVFNSSDEATKLKDASDNSSSTHRTEVATKIISSLSVSKINLKDTESVKLYGELISILRHQGQTTASVRSTIKSFMTKELKNLVTVSTSESKQSLDAIFQQSNLTKDNNPKVTLDVDDSDDSTWISILDPFILYFDGPSLLEVLGQAARSSQLNWNLCHRILNRYYAVSPEEAPAVMLTVVNQFLKDAVEANSFSLFKACFGLAHIVLAMNSFQSQCTPYQDWFSVQFITEKTSVIKSKKTFELFRNTLTQLLPSQLPEYIKMYLRLLPRMVTWNNVTNPKYPYITKNSLGDYIIPAKTKMFELGERFMFEEPSVQAPTASYGDVVKSVNSAIEKFAASEKIPEFVANAFAMQRTWFKNHFLNNLLLPRPPDIVDARSKFIEQLVQEKFILPDLYKEYQEACLKVQRANQIDMDVEVQPPPVYVIPQPGPVGTDGSDIAGNIVDKMKGMCQIFAKMVRKPENTVEELTQTLNNMSQLLWVILNLYDNTLHPHTLHTLSSTLVSTFISCDSASSPEGDLWQYPYVEVLLCLGSASNTGETEYSVRRDLMEAVVSDIPDAVLKASSDGAIVSAVKILQYLSSASHKLSTKSQDYALVVDAAEDKMFAEFPMSTATQQLSALKLCCLYLKHLCSNYKTVLVTGHPEPFRIEPGGNRTEILTMPLSLLQVFKYLLGKLYIRGKGASQDSTDPTEASVFEVYNLTQTLQKLPGVTSLQKAIFEEVGAVFIVTDCQVNPEKNQDLLTPFQRLDWLQITLQKYHAATYSEKETFLSIVYSTIIQLMSHPSFHDSQMMVLLMILKKMTSSEMHCLECADGLLSILKPATSEAPPTNNSSQQPASQATQMVSSPVLLLPDKNVEFIQHYFEVFKLLLESKSFFAPDDPDANNVKDPTLDNPNVIAGIFTELITKLVSIFQHLPRNSEHILNQFNALHLFKFLVLAPAGCRSKMVQGAQHLLAEVPMILFSWISHWSFIQVDSDTEIPEAFQKLTEYVSLANQIIAKTTSKAVSVSFIKGDTMSGWLQAIQNTLPVQQGAVQLLAYSLVKIAITKLETEAKSANFQDLQTMSQDNFAALISRVDSLWNDKNASDFHLAVMDALFSYQCYYNFKALTVTESQKTFKTLRMMVIKYLAIYAQQPEKILLFVQLFSIVTDNHRPHLDLLPALPSAVDYSFTLFSVLFLVRDLKILFSNPTAAKPFTVLILSQYVQTLPHTGKEYGVSPKAIQQWINGCAGMFSHVQVTGPILNTVRKEDPALFAKLKK